MILLPHHSHAVEVCNLVKRYPGATENAADGISFTVQRGEIFGLLGPNGAGKTTVIGTLTTSVLPTSGCIKIMGFDVVRDPISVKQRISVVPQKSNLDQHLNAREILTFHGSYHGVSRAERKARADKLLADFGLTKRAKEKVGAYSGGMAQRIMIARALMHEPGVLFLDEPTNNLDPQTRIFLWERIRSLQASGITILLSTHDMEEANRLCDRVAIIDHGQIIVCDTPAELKKLLPSGAVLELRVSVPVSERTLAAVEQGTMLLNVPPAPQLQSALRSITGVFKVEEICLPKEAESQVSLSLFRLYADNLSALISQVFAIVTEQNAEIHDLHVSHPSLEDVFIYLTGRNLRP